jgi:alcohol dehydrogenase
MSTPPYSSMRAVVVESYGAPLASHVKLTTIPTPTLSDPNDVLIRVRAAALNPVDKEIIKGEMKSLIPLELPAPIGFDVAGVIEAVGASVTTFKPGDEVYSRVDHHRLGTLADYCVTSAASVALKPASLSFDEAASMPLVTLTALQSLEEVGHLSPGQSVLILGGTGGVGTAAIQLARILGASSITVTAGSEFNRCLTLGATKVIDYKNEKFSDSVKDQDLVFDTTGEANSSFSCLKSGGTTVSIIAAITVAGLQRAGINTSLTTQAMLTAASAPVQANALVHNVSYQFVWMKPSGQQLTQVAQWVEEGKLKPVIDTVYPLEQVAKAFEQLEGGHAKGKIVIHIADK